ncbi:hypothetical protein ElyMa_003576100, partial [Elysia marginata]
MSSQLRQIWTEEPVGVIRDTRYNNVVSRNGQWYPRYPKLFDGGAIGISFENIWTTSFMERPRRLELE